METGSVGPAKPAEKYEGGGPGSSPKRRPGPGDARKDEKGWTFRGVITLGPVRGWDGSGRAGADPAA